MASSIARAGAQQKQQVQQQQLPTDSSVASVFSTQTSARLLSHRKGSLVSESSASVDDQPEVTATMATNKNDDLRSLNMCEIQERLKELERHPTQAEIDELMAQYDDDSDDDGSAAAYSDGGSENGGDGGGDNESGEDVIMKVLVVGNARCGKTSTIRRYVSQDFKEEYSSTIGADFIEKTINYDAQLRIHLQLWDIAGQDRFAKLTRAYFREAKGALIVCDITRENTIDAVVTWKNEIDVCCKDLNNGEHIPVVMVANKSDLLLDPMGALNIGVNMQKCVTKNNIIEWFRASAKSGEHVDEAFQCLLDKMVEEYREQQQQRDSTSAASADNRDHDRSYASHDDPSVIRLSQYAGPLRSNRSGSDFCDCN